RGIRVNLCEAADVPISFGGKARFNLANALAAALATYATGIPTSDIISGLLSFYQSAHQTPGRLNFIEMDGFRVLMDYAHNAHGLAALTDLVRQLRDGRLTLIIGLPGDRRDEDIRESVRAVAKTFDNVIVREDFDRRGRAVGEVPALIKDELLAAGVANENIEVFHDESDAVEHAVKLARAGDLIVYIADKPEKGAAILERLREPKVATGDIAVPAPS